MSLQGAQFAVHSTIQSTDPEALLDAASRALDSKDYQLATELCSRALEAKTELLGELHPSLAETYLKYGKCLILSAQHPLKDPTSTVASESNAEPQSETDPAPPGSNSTQFSTDDVKSQKTVTFEDPTESSEEEAEDVEEDFDIDEEDLDIAWDVLEVARILFSQQAENNHLLAETNAALGEVSIFAKRPRVAIADLQRAIVIFDEIEVRNLKQIANAHYLLSIAFEYLSGMLAADPQYATAPELPDDENIVAFPIENREETTESATEKAIAHLQLAIKFVEQEILRLSSQGDIFGKLVHQNDLQSVLDDLKDRLATRFER
eukprot:TRINITY_DN10919_c0_g1_i1.p1 TRINITY_DN10919_c0_g1~~TRINITY_DN10919_c0_g1_i1.p1  ORF type:complete len:321 (-),score=67.47 TRINITY_DN10919_c0_g1_i1:29-991(-)